MSSFFFYDLETSGISPRNQRIMQFAGQRTDMDLKPIGEPENILIKLTPDIVPEPDAIMLTGITPQQTLQDGITEVEFLRHFTQHIATPDTIFVGFNTVRFDDEFMRYLHYRNYYDPYEWQWQDGRSRWDMLDVVRMTRALRPEGIVWPFTPDGKASNRLELLTTVNKLNHEAAHDALSDVQATIAVARLLRNKQPKLFEYLMQLRGKKAVAELVTSGQPFVYTSGRYDAAHEKTTVASYVCPADGKQGGYVFDLRYDPSEYAKLTAEELADKWQWRRDAKPGDMLPVKLLQYNRCPAVAPMGVLDEASQQRLQIDLDVIRRHMAHLKQALADGLAEKLTKAASLLAEVKQTSFLDDAKHVDAQLYDGFFDDHDRVLERAVRVAAPNEVIDMAKGFHDTRLRSLALLYKARNFSADLSDEERLLWQRHLSDQLMQGGEQGRLGKYFQRLGALAQSESVTSEQQFLLEELQLYGQSILPEFDQSE